MKTMIKRIFATTCVLASVCSLLAGCQEAKKQVQYEVPNYQGQLQEGQTKSDFNKELFYRNDHKIQEAPDPFVLDNTAVDGWYYLYGTMGSILTYRSKDLMEWEPVGNALDNLDYAAPGKLSEARRAAWKDISAPEVIYDYAEKLYYMFLSCTPQEAGVQAGKGVKSGDGYEMLIVAVSQYPDRQFQLINFKDAASCGEENLHNFNENPGISDENGGYLDAYPHYYAKYLFFDPADYKAFSEANGGYRGEFYGGYEGGIDPHPYVDADGTKYMFWVDSTGPDRLCGVKMDNWLKPDWSTATVLTYHGFYTVEDWKAYQAGGYVDKVSYELDTHTINEGPQVLAHNGKYYLTFSVNSYADSSYQVIQAVSDNILGPYRKLTEAEGGILISGGTAGSQEVTGTGHHSFVTLGDKMYVIYHRHDNFITAGTARNHAVDEIKWITIKDRDGNDLEVMYANGPTWTVQPRLEAFAEYVNIAPQAKVSGSKDASFLNDDLLSIYKYGDETFMEYIRETNITKTTTFTFTFDQTKTVRAIMVYNSKNENQSFRNISKVEFVCRENGKDVIRCIENIPVTEEYFSANDFDGSIYYVIPGAAAYAEFDALTVKSVKITVEVPKGQESVGISEIRILGK